MTREVARVKGSTPYSKAVLDQRALDIHQVSFPYRSQKVPPETEGLHRSKIVLDFPLLSAMLASKYSPQ